MTHTPLEMQVHLGNPNKARIKGLTIKPMDECEGGGWYMPADQAERIVQAVNSFEAMREALKDTLRILKAVRYTAGLGKKQVERIEAAEAILAKAEARS